MKYLYLALLGTFTANIALANSHNDQLSPAAIQASQAEQAQIKANTAKLPQAEQDRIAAVNAYWAAQSFKENNARH